MLEFPFVPKERQMRRHVPVSGAIYCFGSDHCFSEAFFCYMAYHALSSGSVVTWMLGLIKLKLTLNFVAH